MTQHNQQQNRQQQPQHNQQNRPQQSNTNVEAVRQEPEPNQRQDLPEHQPKQYTQPKKEDFKQLLTRLTNEILTDKLGAEAGRREVHKWFQNLSMEEQQTFKANRIQVEEIVNYLRGVTDTLAQEVPALFVA